ncbi:hypothetical protein N7450_005313 [Penicillium hetheringtonii]|uniref:Uncharacterized protein n=1 Tax=Penicillium hetheringtonii TaxID=911720 RepID=A0AAD6DRT0_9EURO|nr:hypothetical protein N7450_005313 [Penicillium hetheringtonii]
MKYFYPTSLLISLAAAIPREETCQMDMNTNHFIDIYAPCMKDCGSISRNCTHQAGIATNTCMHDMMTCMLKCQKHVYPSVLMPAADCTITAMDEMAENISMDMIQSHLSNCMKMKMH